MSNIPMEGSEFVARLLKGERDFTGIALPPGCDLAACEDYSRLLAYLRGQDLKRFPVNISYSSLHGLKAPELYLPWVIGDGVDLSGADLSEADLERAKLGGAHLSGANFQRTTLFGADLNSTYLGRAIFERANLRYADCGGAFFLGANLRGANFSKAELGGTVLREADLSEADLERANLGGADLRRAKVNGANFRGVYLGEADLRDVAELDRVYGLHDAIFNRTVVTLSQKKIIEEILAKKVPFLVFMNSPI